MTGRAPPIATLGRRLLSLSYEILLIFAVLFFASLLYPGASQASLDGINRHLFQIYEWLVAGTYLVTCWSRGGQTLAMKTWRLKLTLSDGSPLTPGRAAKRYVLASISLLTLGAGFLWALIDRDRQFLHDRLSGTQITVIRTG